MKQKFLLVIFGVWLLSGCNVNNDPPGARGNGNGNGNGRPLNTATDDPINTGACGTSAITDLVAGQTNIVGEVEVSMNGSDLVVSYRTTSPGWVIGKTHLEIEETWMTMPLTPSMNPKVGLFEVQTTHNPYVLTYTYPGIDVSGFDTVTIAAHAEVIKLGGSDPAQFRFVEDGEQFSMDYYVSGGPTYIQNQLTDANGNTVTFDSWCIDQGTPLGSNIQVVARDPFGLTHADLLCLGVNNPANFENALYVVNNDWSQFNASWREIQYAIWLLLEANPVNTLSAIGQISQAIVNAALVDGEGFVPGECDIIPWVIDTKCDPRVAGQNVQGPQSTLIFVRECPEGEETAWGYGPTFPGQNWAMYFRYCVQ